jgi:hypothetical protein
MHSRHNKAKASRKGRGKRSVSLALKAGNVNRPPDNSGTIQIPRPISVRSPAQKRTFKTSFQLVSSAGVGVYAYMSLYAPFGISTSSTGTYGFTLSPNSFTNMLSAFGAYKVRRIQLIFEPLLPTSSALAPIPFIVGMAPDVPTPTFSTLSPLQLEDYSNSTKISPLYPTELTYLVPKLSSAETIGEVLNGGWILSESYQSFTTSGSIVVAQNSGFTAGTTYSQLSVVYDIWFKNPI